MANADNTGTPKPTPSPASEKAEELAAIIQGIRERVRDRYPSSAGGERWQVPLPDLMPLARARDAAEGKVASIGTVNPRSGGPVNRLIQFVKRTVARSMRWHIREQIEFNRHVMTCVQATLDSMNEFNRTISATAGKLQELQEEAYRKADVAYSRGEAIQSEVSGQITRIEEIQRDFSDIAKHWNEWRADWERKVFINETQFLRSAADLQSGFQYRSTQMESNFREMVKEQHQNYLASIERSNEEIQKRFWELVEKARREYEVVIHEELRIARQRLAINAATQPAQLHTHAQQSEPAIDYPRFAEKFRGPESYVRKSVEIYLKDFRGRKNVLDVGCGRGEFLEMLRENGVSAKGIELGDEAVAQCRSRGLDVEKADLFEYLPALAHTSLDGIFCAQVVEHLEPARVPEFVRLSSQCLEPGGILVVETPNPECLAIFASHFYLDPTHQRPLPPALMAFYMEEFGFGRIDVRRLSPAVESMPALAELPEGFRSAFFGGLDYAIVGVKL